MNAFCASCVNVILFCARLRSGCGMSRLSSIISSLGSYISRDWMMVTLIFIFNLSEWLPHWRRRSRSCRPTPWTRPPTTPSFVRRPWRMRLWEWRDSIWYSKEKLGVLPSLEILLWKSVEGYLKEYSQIRLMVLRRDQPNFEPISR